jgi:hypothetical protein
MPKMIAKSSFYYDRRNLTKGAPFEASSRDARLLALIGRADYAEDDEVPAAPRARRQYRRRDLQAGA